MDILSCWDRRVHKMKPFIDSTITKKCEHERETRNKCMLINLINKYIRIFICIYMQLTLLMQPNSLCRWPLRFFFLHTHIFFAFSFFLCRCFNFSFPSISYNNHNWIESYIAWMSRDFWYFTKLNYSNFVNKPFETMKQREKKKPTFFPHCEKR